MSSGLHQGRIEVRGAALTALDDTGALIGAFGSLREAMTAVEGHVTSVDVAA
ncbi:hypothetical protein [Rathayibacter sp. VKM Ac-2928]|uniref:hypothetical protein n=1 Tax=Rathayibacter sp. VKM Ac-2928 TaxID=2929479 RepID=UPI001FB44898|nr:hypothetical protein [Rathayibacter sp. VKM Ac-2928]MCJ1685357.1 hypothetical protein [Rathayibacter sp. VKM Ac-2928]